MPAVSALPRVPNLGSALLVNLYADVQLPDGSSGTYRIQMQDLLPVIVAQAGGNGLPTLDANGGLVIGGVSIWAVDANKNLLCPATIPDTNDGFVPVVGSNVVYTDGGIFKRA